MIRAKLMSLELLKVGHSSTTDYLFLRMDHAFYFAPVTHESVCAAAERAHSALTGVRFV